MKTLYARQAFSISILSGLLYTSSTFSIAAESPIKSNIHQQTTLLPIEQLIAQTRKQHDHLIIHSVRLTQQCKTPAYVIDFTDSDQHWKRWVYNANTGELLIRAGLDTPLPLEQSLTLIHSKYPKHTVIRSYLKRKNGELIRFMELTDHKHQRLEISLDAYTGQILNEQLYNLKPSGKELSLKQILINARETREGMVALRTRNIMKGNIKVREIIYLDNNKIRKKMLVNCLTGEVLVDKPTPWIQI